MWPVLNMGVSPHIIAQLDALSISSPPRRRSETQGSQEFSGVTVPTARSIGSGIGLIIPPLQIFADIYRMRRSGEPTKSMRTSAGGSAADTDWLLMLLAQTYAEAGGRVAMRWVKRDKTRHVGGAFCPVSLDGLGSPACGR